ncbi:MAG: hypothetical protein H0X64_15200 [Gemmatimonadaceae bacterium]|nr:hypothetical protein [Gemmatimonadaceae bacterium]
MSPLFRRRRRQPDPDPSPAERRDEAAEEFRHAAATEPADQQRRARPAAEPKTAALPCPACGIGHLLAHVDLPLLLSVHLTREGQVRPAEVLATKRDLHALVQRDFTPLRDDVTLTCSQCEYASTVGDLRDPA